MDANSPKVFASEAIYRRMGDVRGRPRAHTMWWRGQRWARVTLWCGPLSALLRLPFGLYLHVSKIGTLAFVSSDCENISFGKNLE
jgi:hypothetical protein